MRYHDYVAPESLEEASQLLQEDGTVISAGATDLIGELKGNILTTQPKKVVSLRNIPGLRGIEVKEDGLHVGAMTTLAEIERSEAVNSGWKALADAAHSVATPNLRSTATIGGNICQDIRCWYYRYPDQIGGRINCLRKDGALCYAMRGENRYHSIFGAEKVCGTPCSGGCPAGTGPAAPAGDDLATRLLRQKKQAKITSAIILHIIAFVLTIVACVIFAVLGYNHIDDVPEPPDDSITIEVDLFGNVQDVQTQGDKAEEYLERLDEWERETAERRHSNQMLVIAIAVWIGLSLASMVLGLIGARQARAGKKPLTIASMVLTVAGPAAAVILQPLFIVGLVCGVGLIMLVPPILQLIAGGKLLQAAAIHD